MLVRFGSMAGILRGDIYWADLDPVLGHEQGGRRPVLVLSDSVFNRHSGTVIAIALTSKEPQVNYPLSSEVIGSGLPKRTWAKPGQVRTLSVKRLSGQIGRATEAELSTTLAALVEILGG